MERGYTPDISLLRFVYLEEDAKQVKKEAQRYVRNFLGFNASAIDSLARRQEELTGTGYGFDASYERPFGSNTRRRHTIHMATWWWV